MNDNQKFTEGEIKMRQAYANSMGGPQAYHDAMAQFATAHRNCHMLVTHPDLNSPLAAVYWFHPSKVYIQHCEATAMLVDSIQNAMQAAAKSAALTLAGLTK